MNQLIIWKDIRLFYGSHPREIKKHSHPIIQLVVAIEGSFRSKDRQGNWLDKKGLLFAPNHSHECDANQLPIISLDIDPESSLGEWILGKQLKKETVVDYPSDEMAILDADQFSNFLSKEDWPALRNMIEEVFYYQKTKQNSQKDQRIKDIVDFISTHIHQGINTEMLMEVAHLSESRLIHLFKEEMGLPIRNYILWQRLKIVLELILGGASLTEASYEAGFSDQAHMTRTFTKMFGVPPSLISKNSKFVQVSIPQ